ncbi:MAG: hypothetical protein JWO43_650 [Candidatus Adlerbacteria bacterium]|nr:hypothetical protein [Candidatus Adlerbacteria bacterium]
MCVGAFFMHDIILGMDPDIEEIKEMAKKALALAEDTNRTVHKLRHAAWWGFFFQMLWWGAVLGSSAFAYHYYVQPYVANLQGLYSQVQTGTQQAQSLEKIVSDYVRSHFNPAAPQVPAATSTQQ